MASRGLYGGKKSRVIAVLCIFFILSLVLSMERAVVDVLGKMWATLFLNSLAIVFSITGLLGICANDSLVLLLYSMWSILSIGLNLVLVLVYNEVGLLRQKERYLGSENFWKTGGLGCGGGQAMNTSAELEGSGILVGSSGYELLELEASSCTVPYAVVETVHAALYMLIALVNFILCCWLLLGHPGKRQRVSDCDEDEEFSYVSVAQRYDYPQANRSQRHGYLDYW